MLLLLPNMFIFDGLLYERRVSDSEEFKYPKFKDW